MGTTCCASNIKATTSSKKVKITEKASNPVSKKLSSKVPLITTSTNLTSDYIGNITKNNNGNAHNQVKNTKNTNKIR